MNPHNDYQLLPGKLPSDIMRDLLDSKGGDHKLRPAIKEQPASDTVERYATSTRSEQSTYQMLILPLSLDIRPQANFPYGPDFTAQGFCRWRDWANEAFMSSKERARKFMDVIDNIIPDEGVAFMDHRHRCKSCRNRMRTLVQELEENVDVMLRHSRPEDTTD